MSERNIPDFDGTELAVVRQRLHQRYGKNVDLEQAEVEVRVETSDPDLSWCPGVFWTELGASFVILKLGPGRYRPLFYYQPDQQFGTGRDSYDDPEDCITTLLRLQADHFKEMAGATSGKTGKDLH